MLRVSVELERSEEQPLQRARKVRRAAVAPGQRLRLRRALLAMPNEVEQIQSKILCCSPECLPSYCLYAHSWIWLCNPHEAIPVGVSDEGSRASLWTEILTQWSTIVKAHTCCSRRRSRQGSTGWDSGSG